MKYVRTKDGRIIDVSLMQEFETDDDNGRRIFDGYGDKDGTYYPVENIIRQADAIEELCDHWDFYSCLDGEYKIEPTYILTPHILYLDLQRGYIKDIKLCIRTDKGLVYVAKMNDKGKLELL